MKDTNRTIRRWCLLVALVLPLASCGGDEAPNPELPGGLTFTLAWPSAEVSRSAASGDVCQDWAIETIDVIVNTTGNAQITSKSFPCADHSGFVPVAAGTYNLLIEGEAGGQINWRGQKTGIVVTQGETSNAGSVEMAYIGTDAVKPTVASTIPPANAIGVAPNGAISAVFSEDMAAFSIDTGTFLLKRGTVQITGTVTYTGASRTATFFPSAPLLPSTVYTVIITTGVTDLAGNPLTTEKGWSFTTASGTASSSMWDELLWDSDVWQ